MATLCLRLLDANDNTIAVSRGEDEINLVCAREYQESDRIIFEASEKNIHLWLQFDDAIGKSLVYVTDRIEYKIPFGEKRCNLSPKAFYGNKHLLYARTAKDYERMAYRNLALNVTDQHGQPNCYPHASANVETRGETQFTAMNAIDGVTANESHGSWPYGSWGIGMRDDAELQIDFGRTVAVDRIVLYTRADFPHDNWWRKATFTFSDGSTLEVEMEKSRLPHEFLFDQKKISWVKIGQLIKSEEESPFPALTEIEVYGMDI